MSTQLEQVRRFYSVLWNAHDKSAIPRVLKENVSFRGTQGHEKSGHNGFAEYTDFIHEALGEFQCIIDDIVGDGNTVFAKMIFRGIHQNEFREYQPTGKMLEWAGCARFVFDDDLISDVWVLGDLAELDAQLEANVGLVV